MRSQTQERVEELARERAATAIDLALVEDGIEIGKKMMAEMIANYPHRREARGDGGAASPDTSAPSGNGNGYLNEVSPLNARGRVIGRPPAQRGRRRGRHECRRIASAARTTSRCSSTR